MHYRTVQILPSRRVFLIAHESRSAALFDWARYNRNTLARYELYATGTTDVLLASELGLCVTRLHRDARGGDGRPNTGIEADRIGFVVFFWDSLEPQPLDAEVRALLRIAVVHNVPVACNRAMADYLLSAQSMRRDDDPMLGHRRDREQARHGTDIISARTLWRPCSGRIEISDALSLG